ncbi:SET [Glarea lozoyensis ATCC 20868]|uniref:SET n=1 Tax=Glarea lozoyensis (strain ATCC 20868 / MF5171) TaxID=1116229 RepID=S3CXJ3_GLAL2|nr:SET [Glarea lozoyensis ATCC 20868]EPE24556.1 SET [Glarea lozoyensis ATCC 20868]
MPTKGKGLVARRNISKGERILSEKPLLISPNLSSMSVMESAIAAKLKTLSRTDQRQFLSLNNNFPGKYPFSGIMRTNAFPCGSGAVIGGVYPTICLINHSCLPNAHNNWNNELQWETIHSVDFIKAGEEITITYDHGGPSNSRQAQLKGAFGFDCSCHQCLLPPAELHDSDLRREQIQSLDDLIGEPTRIMATPDCSLKACFLMLQLLEAEFKGNAVTLIGRVYYDAFQICIIHGDQARASIFAQRATKYRVICEGEDSPETINIKSLMKTPTQHASYGASTKWRTAKGLVPKGLDPDDFENWLWREQNSM